jgi:hypothetical protein
MGQGKEWRVKDRSSFSGGRRPFVSRLRAGHEALRGPRARVDGRDGPGLAHHRAGPMTCDLSDYLYSRADSASDLYDEKVHFTFWTIKV